VIDRAIILAAGMGKRMGGDRPKPLLPLDDRGTTFLDWHARALARHGVREIVLVGSDATIDASLDAPPSVQITRVLNDFPGEISGSGHSAHLAFEAGALDDRSRVVLMDADVVYDPSLFAALAERRGRSKTLICARFRETSEEVVVFGDGDGTPRMHGKGLTRPLTGDLSALGEATGILLFEPADHALVRAASSWCMRHSTAKTKSEHEDITQRLMMIGALDAVVFEDDRRFMECDTRDEYEVARREMVPRWSAR
jgi:choline kinase